MWWNGTAWGPMHGWWPMPLFGLICMIVFLYIGSRIFGSGFCGRHHPIDDQRNIDELIREVRELRSEVKALKEDKNPREDSQ